MFNFIFETLRHGGASELLDLVSPSFFEVVPITRSGPLIRNLLKGSIARARPPAFDSVEKTLSAHELSVVIDRVAKGSEETPSRIPPEGRVLLQIYFAQTFYCPESLLDMRSRTFQFWEGETHWNPMQATHRWDRDFIASLQKMYLGFYLEEKRIFREGLTQLGLSSAEELFLHHFGPGDQTNVLFSVSHFRKSFHDIFLHCKERKITLPVDFLPLGMLLGTLYENLSSIGEPQNVREAFTSIAPPRN